MKWSFFGRLMINWWLLGTAVSYVSGTILWIYILKKFPLSAAYPMISVSYVFGMLAAIFIFHETVPPVRWIGVFLILSDAS
jgi:drug/metabolite transporter (DMT)-like permease